MQKVLAFIVTEGNTPWLNKSIFSVLGQKHGVDELFICDIAKEENRLDDEKLKSYLSRIANDSVKVKKLNVQGAKNFSSTIIKAIRENSIDIKDSLLWILHDDCAAYPNCLSEQLKLISKSDDIAIVGAKQLFWKTKRLLEVGYSQTLSGQRVELIWPGEIDQGQHDSALEVFGVSLTGALIDGKVFASIVSEKSFYSIYYESTDFCNKVHLAGKKVLVAAQGRVNHIGASYRDQRGSMKALHMIKSSALYRFSNTKARFLLPMLLYYIVAMPFKTARSFILKQPALALSELVLPIVIIVYLPIIFAQRQKLRVLSKVKKDEFANLFTSYSSSRVVQKEHKDYHKGALTSEERIPTPLEEQQLESAKKRRRFAFGALIFILLAFTFALFGSALAKLFSGAYFAGKGLFTSGATLSDLWQAATTNWSDAGLGANVPPNPMLFLLIPIVFLCGGSVQLTINLFIILSILLSGPAWAAAGVVTRKAHLRFFAGLVWAFCPTLSISIQEGHFSTVIVWIAIPILFYSIIRSYGLGERDFYKLREFNWPSFAVASVMLAVIVASMPILFIPLLLIIILCVRHIGGRRRHTIALLLPTFAAIAPLVYTLVRHPSINSFRVLFSDSSAVYLYNKPASWQTFLGLSTSGSFNSSLFPSVFNFSQSSQFDLLTAIFIFILFVFGILALLRKIRSRYAYMTWIVLILSSLSAILISNIAIASASNSTVYGWSGTPAALFVFTCLVAALMLNAKKLQTVFFSIIVIAFVALTSVNILFNNNGIINNMPTSNSVPAVAVQEESKNENMRVLEITTNPDGSYNYSILRKANQEFVDISGYYNVQRAFDVKNSAEKELEKEVATVVTQPSNADINILEKYNIRGILVPSYEAKSTYYDDLVSKINTVSGLQRVIVGQDTVYWRTVANDKGKATPAAEKNSNEARADSSFFRFIWTALASFILLAYILMMVPITTIRRFLS
ncbi:MAG: hypothetical protein LBB07_02815 [Bifidobacteriaceae bacterium]|nr:hypothetical protein [Bifidobacteriaceae bacterium]